jgi:hypothetical protein
MTDTVIAIEWADRPAPIRPYPWLADLDAAIEDMKAEADPVAMRWEGRRELHKSTNPKHGLKPRKRRRLPFRRWLPRFSFHGSAKWR